jgi:hypothetical protein
LVEAARILPNLWPETPDGPTDVLGELRVLEAIEQILNDVSRIKPTIMSVEVLPWMVPASSDLLV